MSLLTRRGGSMTGAGRPSPTGQKEDRGRLPNEMAASAPRGRRAAVSARDGYGPAGRELVAAIEAQLATDGLEPDARDRQLLDVAARLVDRMEMLQAMVAADGERTISATGVVRLHPAIGELRQHSIAVSKTLAAVALAETSGARKDPDKVRAAETRWRAHNAAKAAAKGAG